MTIYLPDEIELGLVQFRDRRHCTNPNKNCNVELPRRFCSLAGRPSLQHNPG